MITFNYSVRILVAVVGLLVVVGVISSDKFEAHVQQVFGSVMFAFGVYRTLVYHIRRQREDSP